MKKKIIIFSLLIIVAIGVVAVVFSYKKVFKNNVSKSVGKEKVIFLPTGGGIQNIYDSLKKHDILIDFSTFQLLAEYKKLDKKYKAGRYIIKDGMSNNSLINMFISGRQAPISLTFNNIRTKRDLAKRLGSQLECGEDSVFNVLNSDSIAKEHGLNLNNFLVIFIPNTYEVYWNTNPEKFVERMYKEWDKFWTNNRKEKAKKIGLSPIEVTILASIVCGETNKIDEMQDVAGVYINRLHKEWKLQADPTVVFGIGDFSITRVTKKHLEFKSPYNTYQNEGLPPGPINLPSSVAIDKVLNYNKHNYMFFCAREDFSGYHNFAKTSAEHTRNAKKYQAALNVWERNKKKKN